MRVPMDAFGYDSVIEVNAVKAYISRPCYLRRMQFQRVELLVLESVA